MGAADSADSAMAAPVASASEERCETEDDDDEELQDDTESDDDLSGGCLSRSIDDRMPMRLSEHHHLVQERPSEPIRLTRKERKPGQNFAMAAHWYRQAALQGVPEAQCSLAMLYLNGQGVPLDLDCAREWLLKAVAQGHATAKEQLDIMARWDEEEAARVEEARAAEEALLLELGGGKEPQEGGKKKKKKKKKKDSSHEKGLSTSASVAATAVTAAAASSDEELKEMARSKLAALSESDIATLFDEAKFEDEEEGVDDEFQKALSKATF